MITQYVFFGKMNKVYQKLRWYFNIHQKLYNNDQNKYIYFMKNLYLYYNTW